MSLICVGMAEMKLSNHPEDILVAPALGSCLGITLYDPMAHIGGLLHVMLPSVKIYNNSEAMNPFRYVDIGVPTFFKESYAAGARKERLIVKVTGGASQMDHNHFFDIGRRNILMLRKLFWQNDISISSEEMGGHICRTLYLEIGTGRTFIRCENIKREF